MNIRTVNVVFVVFVVVVAVVVVVELYVQIRPLLSNNSAISAFFNLSLFAAVSINSES